MTAEIEQSFYNDTITWLNNLDLKITCETHKYQFRYENNMNDFKARLNNERIIFKHINYITAESMEFILVTNFATVLTATPGVCCGTNKIMHVHVYHFNNNIADTQSLFKYCLDTDEKLGKTRVNFSRLWAVLNGLKGNNCGLIRDLLETNEQLAEDRQIAFKTVQDQYKKLGQDRAEFETKVEPYYDVLKKLYQFAGSPDKWDNIILKLDALSCKIKLEKAEIAAEKEKLKAEKLKIEEAWAKVLAGQQLLEGMSLDELIEELNIEMKADPEAEVDN